MAALPRAGDAYGRFQIQRLIGRGGMGAVFEAFDPTLHRSVALKVVLPDIADIAEIRQRFEREARMLARIRSSHIVHIHDVGEQDDSLYLVTELVPDGDLHSWLGSHGAMSPTEALRLVAQLCEGLADAHKAGILHRDVKPKNVLLWDRDGSLVGYLCDFGIAIDETPGLTKTGTQVGSPEYMAPERHLGQPATARGDIYSLGCVLWACLTGAPPFSGTDYQVMNAHLQEPLPPLSLGKGGAATRDVESFLARLLEKDPADRPGSASEVGREAVRLAERLDMGRASAPTLVTGLADTILRAPVGVQPTSTGSRETVVGGPTPGFLTANFDSSQTPERPGTGTRLSERKTLGMVAVIVLALIAIALGGVAVARIGADDSDGASDLSSSSESEADPPPSVSADTGGSTGPATDAFVCWDGRAVSSDDECREPHGNRGMYWIFPGMKGQNCRPKVADPTPGRLELMECFLYDRQVRVNLSRWESTPVGVAHYSTQENLGEPVGQNDESGAPATYSWQGTSNQPGYPYKTAYLWTSHAYSVSIYASSSASRDAIINDPNLIKPVPDDEYYGSPAG